MDMKQPIARVSLRMQLEPLQQAIEYAMIDYCDELQAQVTEALSQAIAEYDISREARNLAETNVRETLEKMVKQAVAESLCDSPVKEIVDRAVEKGLHEFTDRHLHMLGICVNKPMWVRRLQRWFKQKLEL